MSSEMLRLEGVSAAYADRTVVSGVDLRVDRGEFVGLIGPNGCGKSTLFRVISGVKQPLAGLVRLKDRPLAQVTWRDRARIMACLSQELALEMPFTVREVAMMGRTPHIGPLGRETRADLDAVDRAMSLADVASLADRPITELSGGERQRAFIAMCLAQQPELLLLDEPTSHLDIGHQLAALDLIRRLNEADGLTVLAVFHDLNLACEYCDRLYLMQSGRIVTSGPPAEVVTAQSIREVYNATVLTQSNPVSGRPHVVVAGGTVSRRTERPAT